jgi:hypothetical protein
VVLAPVAAALVLLSASAGGLRVAAVLAILTVVLVGLSIMLRPDARTVRIELEDQLFEEIDALREDIRRDIATAARATHRSYAEKLQSLYQTVEALRNQVEGLRPEPLRPEPPAGTSMVSGGVLRHTETLQVTTHQMFVDPDRSNGTVYGAARPAEESWTEQRLRERFGGTRRDEVRRDEARRDEVRRDDTDARPRPGDNRWDTPAHGLPASGAKSASAWTQSWREDPTPVNPRPRRPAY